MNLRTRTARTFTGKVVVITGAAGGMGQAFARRFARAGARLLLLDLAAEPLAALAGELGDGGEWQVCDVTDERACRRAIDRAVERFGGVDLLINNAGITHRSAFEQTDVAVFRRLMEVNFFGSLSCTKAAMPSLLERRGQIIVISSIAGFAPLLGRSGYAASKHALHGMFESLRAEVEPRGVDVMIVCPGFTATGICTNALDGDGSVTRHPQSTLGRVAQPDEVAEAVFEGASRRQRLLVLSPVGKLTRLITRFMPHVYERLMARSLARELDR